jgi:hypothetical protein
VCSANSVYAQSDTVTIDVELSHSQVYVGDEITFQILVRGSNNPPSPEVLFPDSVQARFHGRTSQQFTSMRVVNGRNRTVTDRRYSFQYTLTSVDAGTITIPAPSIEIDGQTYTGESASFESLFPTESAVDHLEVSIPRDVIYLNETIEVECTWWIGDQTSDFNFTSSSIPRSFEIRGLEPRNRGAKIITFAINGQKMVGAVDTGFYNGKEMSKMEFILSITMTKVGKFDLGPMRAVFTRHAGTGNNYRAYVESESIELNVIQVPLANRPSDYTGAIGAFQLTTQASNTSVNVGDPITLRLRVSGQEPMIGVENAPDISSNKIITDSFKVSSEGWRETLPRQTGHRIYETTIRAIHDQVDKIPAIELPSFNTTTGTYRLYRSEPINITVNPVEELTLSDAIITGGQKPIVEPKSVDKVELTRAMPGLWAHGSADDMMSHRGFSVSGALSSPVWIAVIASSPTLFALSCVTVLVRRASDPRKRSLRIAWRESRAIDRQGEHAQAIRVYIAAVLGLNAEAITADDARRLPLCEHDAQELAQCLINHEHRAFVGTHNSATSNPQSQSGLLKRVHAQLQHAEEALT